jgi:hypothetical protein
MSEAAYVEMPVIQWMCGEPPTPYRTDGAGGAGIGLGWTYRDEAAMAAFDRPLALPGLLVVFEQPLVLLREVAHHPDAEDPDHH